MQTYQVRRRVLRTEEAGSLTFPGQGRIVIALNPRHVFGGVVGRGQTFDLKHGDPALGFDREHGRMWMEQTVPLEAVTLRFAHGETNVEFMQNIITLERNVASEQELLAFIEELLYTLPLVLGLEFVEAFTIESVHGEVGGAGFKLELPEFGGHQRFIGLNRQQREERLAKSWARLPVLTSPHNRRWLAALYYFHVACRLERVGQYPWEFMPEILLNLSKILEVLFPGAETIDSARAGLAKHGYSSQDIERKFIPVMALRSGLDVAHVFLSSLEAEALSALHDYSDTVEASFHGLLVRVAEGLEAGDITIERYEPANRDSRKVRNIVERLGH